MYAQVCWASFPVGLPPQPPLIKGGLFLLPPLIKGGLGWGKDLRSKSNNLSIRGRGRGEGKIVVPIPYPLDRLTEDELTSIASIQATSLNTDQRC